MFLKKTIRNVKKLRTLLKKFLHYGCRIPQLSIQDDKPNFSYFCRDFLNPY
jgi:hypothetical protein